MDSWKTFCTTIAGINLEKAWMAKDTSKIGKKHQHNFFWVRRNLNKSASFFTFTLFKADTKRWWWKEKNCSLNIV